MCKKIKIDDIQFKIDNLNLQFKIIEYKPNGQKCIFKHICGHIFETKLSHLLTRNRCPICNRKRRDKNMFQNESDKIHNNEYEIIDFISGNKPVKIKHKVCGYIFNQIGHRHLRGDRCFNCYGNKKLTKDDIIERSKIKWNDNYEIISDNIDYGKKSIIRHKVCGYEYSQLVSAHLLGNGCPKCAGNAPLTILSTQEKSNKIHNFEYEILSEPKGAFSKIQIRHNKCGRIFKQVVSDHFSGCGCSFCNQSKFENYIEDILKELGVKFEKQKTFDGCKFKNKLRFDFYISSDNICIEFDGIQHFKSIRFFGGDKSFELQRIKDDIKNKYCYDNNINLVRFNYKQDLDIIRESIYNLLKKNCN